MAAPIVWGPVTSVAGDTDVLTAGTLNYGYALSGASPTVNGVPFTGSTNFTTLGTNITLTGWSANHTAYTSGANPYAALSAAYKDQIRGGNYTSGATAASLQLNNLTIGHDYATQIWVNDSRGCCAGRTETLTGGANTVILDYGNTNVEGAVGSYSVGLFNANAVTQSFTLQGNASTQFNSVQVRDVTNLGYWTGTAGATWDASTTANFATNLFSGALVTSDFGTAKAPLNAVNFGDAYWNSGATTAVTQNTVDIAAGGVSAGRVIFNNSAVNYTLNSADATGITGATELAFTGSGSRTLTGSHTYTGPTTITGGTVSLTGSATLGGGTYAGAIFNAGTLALNSSANQTLSGVISGSGGALTKNGSGVLTISGANTFSGNTTISAGRVIAGSASAFGAAANTITVASGASLDFNAQTLQGYTNNISIAGAGTIPSLGALGNTNAVVNVNAIRGITLTANASIGGDGGRWDIGRLDFNANPAITVDHITGNGFVLTKVGTSYLGLLTGAANLSGFVIAGGTVAPHENTSFGAGPVTMKPGTVLQPWGGTTIANALNLEGGTLQTDGFQETFTGAVSVTGATALIARAGGNVVLNGNISGNGAFNKTGPFSVLLGGNNSGYTGTYTNAESNTFFASTSAASAGAAYVQNTGNLANTTAGVVTQNLGSLSGSGGNLGNNVAGGAVTFSVGALGTNTTFSGNILDTVGGGGTTAITKIGAGKLTLAGAGSSFTGGINVAGGELAVTGSITGSAVNVNSSGKLSGTGSITTTNQNITLAAGSFLAPGSSPGNLTFNTGTGVLDLSGAVAGSATGALLWEIDSTPALSDLVTLTGTLNIGAGLLEFDDFNFIFGTLTNPSIVTLIDSSTPITGTLGTNIGGSLGPGLFGTLAIQDGGTNLVLQVVPEPGSATLGLMALVGLGARRRRR